MPTYSYSCKDCDHRFDQVQGFTESALTVCPRCGGHLRKLFGSVGVVFKGSGFYRTDSRGARGRGLDKPPSKSDIKEAAESVKSSESGSGKSGSGGPKDSSLAKSAESTGSSSKAEAGASGKTKVTTAA